MLTPVEPHCTAPRIVLKVLKLEKSAILPSFTHKGDSGLDLRNLYPVWITEKLPTLVETGLAFKVPAGYEIQIRPRSGLSALGYTVAFGTVDNGYRGHVKICMGHVDPVPMTQIIWEQDLEAEMKGPRKPDFEAGSKIAQMVLNPFIPAHLIEIREVDSFSDDTSRGTQGFGSSGVK